MCRGDLCGQRSTLFIGSSPEPPKTTSRESPPPDAITWWLGLRHVKLEGWDLNIQTNAVSRFFFFYRILPPLKRSPSPGLFTLSSMSYPNDHGSPGPRTCPLGVTLNVPLGKVLGCSHFPESGGALWHTVFFVKFRKL